MKHFKKLAAFPAVGSVAVVMGLAVLAAGCSGGGSSGGGGTTTNPVVQPQAVGQVSDKVVSTTTPQEVVVEFNVEMDKNETLNASKIEVIQNPNNPEQIDKSKINISFPSTTTPGLSVPGSTSGATRVVSVKITWPKPGPGTYRNIFKINGDAGSAQFPEHSITVKHDPKATNFALTVTSGTGTVTTTATWGIDDPDSPGAVTSHIDWGDGNTATPTSPTATHTYTSAGTFNVKLTLTDQDQNVGEATATVTVNSTTPPTPNPLTIVGAAKLRIPLVGNETEADVLTRASGEQIQIRGLNFKKDMANRVLKAKVNNVEYPVYVQSDGHLVFDAPNLGTPGTFSIALAAYDKSTPPVLVEQAQVSGVGPTLKYAHTTGNTVVHAGDDSSTTFDGTMLGYDINAAGIASNHRQVYAGINHKWGATSSYAPMNDGKTIWGLGNTNFQVHLFKVDATGGVAAVTTNISTSPATNQSPSLLTTSQDGRPVFLTHELAGFYRLWVVKHDLSAVDTVVHFNVAGEQLPAGGNNVTGLHTVVADGVEYAIIIAGDTVRKLFQVRLDNGTYSVSDLGLFAPQASCLYLDYVNNVSRIELAGQSVVGAGTDHASVTIGTGSALNISAKQTTGSSTNKVLGVQGYRDQNSALRVAIVRQSENSYALHDPSNGYNFLSSVNFDSTTPTNRNGVEMQRAPGMNAFVVGFQGAGGAGVLIVPFDGGATKEVSTSATDYVSLAIGKQVVDVKYSSPAVSSKHYNSFTDTTSAVQPYNLGRNGGGPTKYGVSP